MKRRDFISKGIGAGLLAGGAATLGPVGRAFAQGGSSPQETYDLVAVKGGEADKMFDLAMEAIGGMQKYVKTGQTVVVKPNIGWDVGPNRAGNTNPQLVKRIIEHCYDAGAKQVYLFDNTCDNWNKCYENSGIETVAKDAGAQMVPGHTEKYYHEVPVTKGKRLTTTKVHELILESDVFINVPVLKSHSSTRVTVAMKNLMGVVWDRGYWHKNDLHQCIADYVSFYRKPDLNIVDAYRVMMKNGPRGVSVEDIAIMKNLLVSEDIVAIDAAATKIFGIEPEEIGYIKIADEMGLGTMDLKNLNIKRIKV